MVARSKCYICGLSVGDINSENKMIKYITSNSRENTSSCNICSSRTSNFIISQFICNGVDDPEQQSILDLPFECNSLIVGGPGSGKTLLASIRAKQASIRFNKTLLLVYNRPLRQLFNFDNGDFPFQAKTYHSWLFNDLYRKILNKDCPKEGKDLDWTSIESDTKDIKQCYDYIIVDEGQDFPIELLRLLKRVSRYIIVFLDLDQRFQNQFDSEDEIEQEEISSERKDRILSRIKKELDVPPLGFKQITKNFRNSKTIFNFAKDFSYEEDAYDPMICQNNRGDIPIVYKFPFYDDYTFDKIWDKVAQYVKNNEGQKVGIILKKINSGKRAKESLKTRLLDKKIFLYKRTRFGAEDVEFENDIVILSINTDKGLGFDAVFLVYITGKELERAGELPTLMRKYYVAATRAKKFLGVFCSGSSVQIRRHFGKDGYIIEDI